MYDSCAVLCVVTYGYSSISLTHPRVSIYSTRLSLSLSLSLGARILAPTGIIISVSFGVLGRLRLFASFLPTLGLTHRTFALPGQQDERANIFVNVIYRREERGGDGDGGGAGGDNGDGGGQGGSGSVEGKGGEGDGKGGGEAGEKGEGQVDCETPILPVAPATSSFTSCHDAVPYSPNERTRTLVNRAIGGGGGGGGGGEGGEEGDAAVTGVGSLFDMVSSSDSDEE